MIGFIQAHLPAPVISTWLDDLHVFDALHILLAEFIEACTDPKATPYRQVPLLYSSAYSGTGHLDFTR